MTTILVNVREITQVCDPEKVKSAMLAAKETGGKVFVYKRKKEICAVCIFRREEREIPLGLATKEGGFCFCSS